MRNCCDIFLLFLLYIIYHISFHFILSLPPFHESTKLYFSASAHIFFSSYLYFSAHIIQSGQLCMETYSWGLLGQCFRSKWSFNYCNFTQSPSSPCWGLWYACQFYNLFIFLSWSNAVLSFVNDKTDMWFISSLFFPFLVLTLQCMEYVWGPVSQITGSTAVRDVQMDGLWSH